MGGTGSGRKPSIKDEKRDRKNAEAKVVQLFSQPRLDTIPDPDLPFGEVGKLKYREVAEMLLKAGQLTIITKGFAENAAIAFENIKTKRDAGKAVTAADLQQYNRALGNIQQFDIDKNVAGTPTRENKFRFAGFASRRR